MATAGNIETVPETVPAPSTCRRVRSYLVAAIGPSILELWAPAEMLKRIYNIIIK